MAFRRSTCKSEVHFRGFQACFQEVLGSYKGVTKSVKKSQGHSFQGTSRAFQDVSGSFMSVSGTIRGA